MQIILTHEESEKFFENALCNSLNQFLGYGLKLLYDKQKYHDARDRLANKNFIDGNVTPSISYEDILIEMLRGGDEIRILDVENITDEVTIGIEEVWDRVRKSPIEDIVNMHLEQDDADTGDHILQTVCYNEIIFG